MSSRHDAQSSESSHESKEQESAPAPYSRENPSARYRDLLARYTDAHEHGMAHLNMEAKHTFPGQTLPRHAENIGKVINLYAAKSILDYGSGKGLQYRTALLRHPQNPQKKMTIQEYWQVDRITCYDPAFAPYSHLPEGQFDGVVCTDVLEHCPQEDMEWIVRELFSYARHFIYLNVACYPARKTFADGENVHCTVQSKAWWQTFLARIGESYPNVHLFAGIENTVKRDGKMFADLSWFEVNAHQGGPS